MDQTQININCLLCKKNNPVVIDTLSVPLLLQTYKRTLQTHIETHGIDFINLYICKHCGLKFFHPILTGSENFYESLQRFSWYYLEEKQEYFVSSQYILPTDQVLEVGAGRGIFATKIHCKSYVGLEFSLAAVQMAKEQGVQLYQQSIEEHSAQYPASYDVVCSFQVLEHVANIYGFIEGSIRSLKPGGKLIISVPNDNTYIGLQADNILNMPPHHISRWTDDCLSYIANVFPLRLIATYHDEMSEREVLPYARCLMHNGIREIIGRPYHRLDPLFQKLPLRVLVRFLSVFPRFALRNPHLRPLGHSVTAIYQKL